jgi:ABC-type uncharacterized transport system substrate-binding protein
MPMACEQRDFSISGCLVSYEPSFDAMYRRAAYYVDKILKGAKPAELPLQRCAARARMILSPTRVKGAEMFRAEVSRLIKFAEINLNERCSL